MEWIKCSDALPKESDVYWIYPHKKGLHTAFYNVPLKRWEQTDQNGYEYQHGYKVTHWMPLPPPPKE